MRAGDVIEGRFELVEVLGQGGMGQVFRASDRETGTSVAIKTLLPQFLADPVAARDLEREVRVAGGLRHPRIVEIHELRSWEATPYIVMEFVEGQSLSHVVFEQPGEKLGEAQFLGLAEQILSAVGHAHAQGVVHRDLKPGNIIVRPDGQVKLLDFGIAATVRATYTRLTGHASALTIQYASPEQINGNPPSPGMDIYSLGCVFYEMLAGHPPFFRGDILHQHLTRAPEPLAGVSPRMGEAILACLEKDPRARPASAAELLGALAGNRTVRGVIAPTPVVAPPAAAVPAPAARSGPGSLARPMLWGSLGLAAAGAALAVWALAFAPRVSPGGSPIPAPEPASPQPSPSPQAVARSAAPPREAEAERGFLQVIAIPWADVAVDGTPVDASSLRKLPLSAGPHTVRLGHPDFNPLVKRIHIRPGERLLLTVDLPEEAVPRGR